jgi:rhamnogalacturonyl hydrolase YesR
MFAYVLLKGARKGWLDDSFRQAGIRAYQGIIDQFVRVNAGAWLPPFRAFLQVTSSSRRLAVVIGDKTTTGIDRGVTINGPASATEWHAIDGRRLNGKPTQGGMYINNGKIVIVR